MPLSTHVLDTTRGCGAAGMLVVLQRAGHELAQIKLDNGGRGAMLEKLTEGHYELLFHAGAYQGRDFYDIIPVHFHVTDADQKYHIPLILGLYGYSTYRGG